MATVVRYRSESSTRFSSSCAQRTQWASHLSALTAHHGNIMIKSSKLLLASNLHDHDHPSGLINARPCEDVMLCQQFANVHNK